MRWQGRRESDNVEDRRNSSGGPSMGGLWAVLVFACQAVKAG
ncbi:neutral zinc metallopeptidase [Escherichia coli]|nr:hypothetical protein [Escherichia coli]